jgi:hypothetical protein
MNLRKRMSISATETAQERNRRFIQTPSRSLASGNQSLDSDTRRLAGSLRSGRKGSFGRKVSLPFLREVGGQTSACSAG